MLKPNMSDPSAPPKKVPRSVPSEDMAAHKKEPLEDKGAHPETLSKKQTVRNAPRLPARPRMGVLDVGEAEAMDAETAELCVGLDLPASGLGLASRGQGLGLQLG